MIIATWLRGLVGRRGARLGATAGGVAVAVALLASIGSFLSASKATMTLRATQGVAVDWQVELQPDHPPDAVISTIRSAAAVQAAAPVGFGTTSGLQATTGGSTQTTGPGVVVGLPDTYAAAFPGQLRFLNGSRGGVLVGQQTAANLHVAPGDRVVVGRSGMPPATVTVDGVVDLPQADTLFQHVGAPAGSQPQAPPDNVLILPLATWHRVFDPLARTRPDLIHMQAHVLLVHHLPSDPAAAYTAVTQLAHHVELRLAGGGVVGDNLAATLGAARSDALYAQILFLFLGAPGAVVAGMLAAAVAGSAGDRRRREQALLRARGATVAQLIGLGAGEAVLVGLVAIIVGLAGAALIGQLAFGRAAFGATGSAAAAWGAGAAALGLGISLVTLVYPAWRDARAVGVNASRRTVGRGTKPLWIRLGLDFWLLALSGLVFWLSGRGGYQLVLAPEGTPSISVSYWAFAGPLLLWTGAALFTWRVARFALGRSRLVARAARPLAAGLSGTVAAAMARQRQLLARAVVLVGLTLSFAASTAVFNSTYRQQSEADARLTNGGDVTVTEPPGSSAGPAQSAQLASIRGVRHVESLQHRYAYVGADLQDLFGVNPTTIGSATRLQDAYFQGGTAQQLMARLAAQPNGILVSAETVRDFQLSPGDTVRLRLQDAQTRQLVAVPFRYVGIAKEFPTAPKDSFLVANAAYVAAQTRSAAVAEYLLATSGGSPATVAHRVAAAVGPGATIMDIQTTRRVVGSSLTAVDLSGLTRVELGFAVGLAAAATGLVLALGLTERRRTLAIAATLGARRRQLGAFVWTEAGFVAVAGILAGAVAGWLLSEMLVKVLTGVFDPPPASLAVPWVYLAGVATATLASAGGAAAAAISKSRTPPLEVLRDL